MSDQNNDEVVMWQKLAAESFNLDMPPYPYQYVQDEELVFSKYFCKGVRVDTFAMLPISRGPILKHTVTGKVIVGETVCGYFSFVGNPDYWIDNSSFTFKSVKIDYETRIITLNWSHLVNPFDVKVLVSYEYNYAESEQNDKYLPKQTQQVIIE